MKLPPPGICVFLLALNNNIRYMLKVAPSRILRSTENFKVPVPTANSPPPRTGAKDVATKPQRQSSFRSGATFPYREFPYAKFSHREIPYALVQFQKWRHVPQQGISLCRISSQGNSLCSSPVLEVAPLLPTGSFPMQNSLCATFPIENFPAENFRIGNFPIGTFLFLAPLLQKISLQKICCVIQFHSACSILPVVPLVGGEGSVCGGSANPAPVVAANFLYLGAQNPSASPVKEVAPPVRGGGVGCRICQVTTYALRTGVKRMYLGWERGVSCQQNKDASIKVIANFAITDTICLHCIPFRIK